MNALLAILNVFINPAETVRRIQGKTLAWLPPLAVGGLIMAFYNYNLAPMTMQALRNDPPPGMTVEKLDQMVGAMQSMARFSALSAPMMYAMMTMIGAAVIFAACVILRVNLRFPDLYSVMAHVGLINALQLAAHMAVLKNRGALLTPKEMVPPFGLNVLLADGAPKLLQGAAGFFTIFTVWHIVVAGLAVAALAHVPRSRGFLVTAPSWVLGLIFALIGSLFR